MALEASKLQTMSEAEKRAYLKELLAKQGAQDQSTPRVRTVASLSESAEFVALQEQKRKLSAWGAADVYFNETDGISRNILSVKGREVINFSGYNYLGLSGHPAVSDAAKKAIQKYGTSVSASRIASGEKPVHRELEKEISELLGTEDAIAMVGGYSTNESIIGHIMGSKDLILYDSFIHESIQCGSQLSGATIRPFPHDRLPALENILADQRGRFEKALIVIEGVYSMDGDIPDLPELVRIKDRYETMLMVDEAHSLGVIGKTGRGIAEHHKVDRDRIDLWMGTLSKTFASCGGFIAGSRAVVEYLKFTTPGFVYSVGITPADAAAARQAIRILKDEPERVRDVQSNSRHFLDALKNKGWNTGPSKDSAVIPLILGDSAACLDLHHRLFEQDIFVIPVIYPAVPENASRLRFFINSTHTQEQLNKAISAIERSLS